MVYYKIVNFDHTGAGLTSKWVEFCQQFNGAIRTSLTAPYDNVRRRQKGVVASYQIRLILPSVAQTHPKMYPSRCNLQYSICRHAVRKVLSLEYHHSLF